MKNDSGFKIKSFYNKNGNTIDIVFKSILGNILLNQGQEEIDKPIGDTLQWRQADK